jgi:hypothetical protein
MTVHLAFSRSAQARAWLAAIMVLASVLAALAQVPGQTKQAPSQVQTTLQRPSPAPAQPQGQRPEQAQQQTQIRSRTDATAEFRTALEPHGRWQISSRWGEVWVPANRPRDWRPYTVGHWVYTDDWGWYWIEDQSEAVWGMIVFHYG